MTIITGVGVQSKGAGLFTLGAGEVGGQQKGHDGADLLATALETQNIAFVPGSAFFPDGSGRNTLRLNFSSPNETQIEEGMRRLGLLLTA